MRIAHYLNQFFGGLGGEEHAGAPLEQREGPVGPGRLLQQTMGSDATVVTTFVCGDNYGAENIEAVTEQVLSAVKAANVDLFVAGPCFEAGRYGIVAGQLCTAVQEELGIPAVTAMAGGKPRRRPLPPGPLHRRFRLQRRRYAGRHVPHVCSLPQALGW